MRKTWVVGVIVVLGILLICTPYIKMQIIHYMSVHHNDSDLTVQQLAANNERGATFDFNTITAPSMWDTLKGSVAFDKKAIIGQITIKSVHLNLPILKGTTNQNLLVGATTMRADQQMGEGNYPLAGHHMRQQNVLFSPLVNIQPHAEVDLTNKKNKYIYQVVSKKIIDKKESGVIRNTKEKQLTLITCDTATQTNKRIFVRAKLMKVEPLGGHGANVAFNAS